MLEYYYTSPKYLVPLQQNYLADYLNDMSALFHQRDVGYYAAHSQLANAALFGDWLQDNHRPIKDIEPEDRERFLAWRYPDTDAAASEKERQKLAVARVPINRILRMVREKHPRKNKPTSIDKVIVAVAEHFDTHCGYAPGTIKLYCKHIRRFLKARFGDAPVRPASIKPMDVHDYVLKQLERYHPRTVAHDVGCALRLYFNYLTLHSRDATILEMAIPRIRRPRPCLSQDILSDEDLELLWGAFDMDTSIGLRDYAAVLCMTDLAMRVSSVTRLSRDDINWRRATINVHSGKRDKPLTLPLPHRVGEAIANYLCKGRPDSESRTIFLRHRRPYDAAASTGMIRSALRHAYVRSGLADRYHGAHILRHTAATRMRRARIGLKPLGDVLGHQTLQTTTLYAQVDLPALQAVARPWPEGAK